MESMTSVISIVLPFIMLTKRANIVRQLKHFYSDCPSSYHCVKNNFSSSIYSDDFVDEMHILIEVTSTSCLS